MQELKALNNKGILYSAYTLDDGNSFVHIAMYADEETMNIATNIDSLKQVEHELKASWPLSPLKPENLNLVATAFELFG